MSSDHIIGVVFIHKVTNSSNRSPVSRNQPDTDETTESYSNPWPWPTAFHLLSIDQTLCMTVSAFGCTPFNTPNTWWEQIEDKMATAHHPMFYPLKRTHIFILSRGKRGGEEKKKKHSITQRLGKQAGELLGRRDCHVCINRHWFFCPVLAPQPFILSLVVGAQRGWRNSVTVQLGPWGLCVRIDFTCKRGEGLKPLNKGRLCHQRAGWVKSHWMDNDTYYEKRGRMRDRKMEREEREKQVKLCKKETGEVFKVHRKVRDNNLTNVQFCSWQHYNFFTAFSDKLFCMTFF